MKNSWTAILFILFLSVPIATPMNAEAAGLSAPTGRVILSISGAIKNSNTDGRAEFDANMLEQLGMVEIKTSTPYTEGVSVWKGVPIERLLKAVGADDGKAHAVASNDYAIDIPAGRLTQTGAFLALYKDGERLRRRSKGPLWIMFPWDKLQPTIVEELKHYSVWNLQEITFE